MTQEEKELLLKDLCARLPYGVMCYNGNTESNFKLCDVADIDSGYPMFDYGYGKLENIKPYLRPMSSMTKDEAIRFQGFKIRAVNSINIPNSIKMIDWLNENHFDHRGLIEKGLALEAPEDMYKEK